MLCSRCGAEITPGSLLCDGCGAVVPSQGRSSSPGPSDSATRSILPPTAGPAASGAYPAAMPEGARESAGRQESTATTTTKPSAPTAPFAKHRSLPPWSWGLIALAAVAALILAAGFLWPGWFRGERKELNEPERVVDTYFQAMARRDGAAVLDLLTQGDLEAAMRVRGLKDPSQLAQAMTDNLNEIFPRGDLRLSGLEYESTVEGDRAVVRVVKGKATYTDGTGSKVTETPESGGNVFFQTEFRLILEEGRWFITML